MVIRQRPHALC